MKQVLSEYIYYVYMLLPLNVRIKIQFSYPLGGTLALNKESWEPLFVWLRYLSTELRMKERLKLKVKSQTK